MKFQIGLSTSLNRDSTDQQQIEQLKQLSGAYDFQDMLQLAIT